MGPELTALLGLIAGGGPYVLAAVFAILYWKERERADAKDTLVQELLERTLTALNGNGNALGDLRVYLGMNRTDQGRQ